MDWQNIPQGSIILAPTYLHTWIRTQLLQHQSGIADVALYSFSTYFLKEEHIAFTDVFTLYHEMQKLLPDLTLNKNNALTLSFLNELYSALKRMKQFALSAEDLPEQHAFQKEQKAILQALYHLPMEEEYIREHIMQASSFNQFYILDEYCDIFTQKMYHIMEEKGAIRLHFMEVQPKKQFYHALNKRQEVESAAHYILTHDIDATDVAIIALEDAYLPYIRAVFARYHIPFYMLEEQEHTLIQAKFTSLLSFYLHPDHEHSLQLLQTLITHTDASACMTYLSIHKRTLLDDTPLSFPDTSLLVEEKEKKALQTMQEKAMHIIREIQPFLCALLQKKGMDVIYAIDDFLCETHSFEETDYHAFMQIRKWYEKAAPYCRSHEDLSFFLDVVEQMKSSKKPIIQGCAISSLQKPLPYHKIQIVLGATQDAFLAFTALSGMFEETYFANLAYPSRDERYDWHKQQILRNLKTCENLLVWYPLSTFDGKTQEVSLEMESFMQTSAVPYLLPQTNSAYAREYHISETQAKALFTKQNTVYGSISSLERYASCPYAYFLRYGLRLEEPMSFTYRSATTGRLYHAILEILTKRYGKQYTAATKKEVRLLLHERLEEVRHYYPALTKAIAQLEKRMLPSLMRNLQVLQEQEAHSSLTPYACEYRFAHTYQIDETYRLKLHGIIDRIDANRDFFSILDYKSSSHDLKESLVFSAQQLQLVIYATVMEQILDKRLLGGFYYSFFNPNINMYFTKLKKRPLAYHMLDHEAAFQTFLKEKKKNGWIMNEDIAVMDNDGTHIKGVRASRSSGISARTIYHSRTLSHYMEDILKQLIHALLQGHIECESSEQACAFCPYASLCANANHPHNKQEWIHAGQELYLKGGKRDA